MRTKHTFRLPSDVALKLADYASRKRVPQAHIVETALASFLSPDASERLEGALGRRLDRLVRQVERLERNVTISNETLALFVRFWLTATPPLPDAAQPAAQEVGQFVLGRGGREQGARHRLSPLRGLQGVDALVEFFLEVGVAVAEPLGQDQPALLAQRLPFRESFVNPRATHALHRINRRAGGQWTCGVRFVVNWRL